MTPRTLSSALAFATAIVLALPGAACSRASAGTTSIAKDAKRYEGHGVVKLLDVNSKTVLIAHEEIPGYMKAMTMGFVAKDAAQVQGIAAGDTVDFAFVDDDGTLRLEKITKK